jgi:uncharacterized repeat protein (TIGR01451 family)
MVRHILLLLVCFSTQQAAAGLLSILVDDPRGDNTGHIDVTRFELTFEDTTGEYTIELNSSAIAPFVGEFRINVNLFNPDTGTTAKNPSFFSDTFNDFNLGNPTTLMTLTGRDERLLEWNPHDRVYTNSLENTGNPDDVSLFRSAVASLPGDFLENEDTIAFADLSQYALIEPVGPIEEADIFVSKTVDKPNPTRDEVVEFKIEVGNTGPGEAMDVVVNDRLPPAMKIPEGLGVFTSVGEYDPDTGDWLIGAMENGVTEVMTIPAQIHVTPQPVCVINEARAMAENDRFRDNNSSIATLQPPGIVGCIDLSVEITRSFAGQSTCGKTGEIYYFARVTNLGPHTVHNVLLEAKEELFKAPGFAFRSSNCQGLRCNFGTFNSGTTTEVRISSDPFKNSKTRQHRVSFTVAGPFQRSNYGERGCWLFYCNSCLWISPEPPGTDSQRFP